jgi:hypothetical protein
VVSPQDAQINRDDIVKVPQNEGPTWVGSNLGDVIIFLKSKSMFRYSKKIDNKHLCYVGNLQKIAASN